MTAPASPSQRRPRSPWRLSVLLAGGLAIAALGCGRPVNYDYSAGINYSGYKTFDWTAEPPGGPPAGGGFDNAIMAARVQRIVEAQLNAKGFRRETRANPDFLVSYRPQREPDQSHRVRLGLGLGLGPMGMGLSAPVGDPNREAVAGILLEVQDFKTRNLIWKGIAPDVLHSSDSPEQADQAVTEAVHTLLGHFPPK